jgi:hypothetical protein
MERSAIRDFLQANSDPDCAIGAALLADPLAPSGLRGFARDDGEA